MNSEPVISVLIPTHDRPRFLREAITSVLENGFDDLEIIVSDDSPSGSGAAVVDSFSEPRLRYVHNLALHGKAGNWQCAALESRGRYGFKLDDDDRILPGFLKRCVDILEKEPDVASVYTGHRIRREADGTVEEVVDRDFFGDEGRVDGCDYFRAVLANEGGYPRNQKTAGVFRRAAAEKMDFYRHASEDFAFSAALGLFGRVAYVPEVLYEWHVHGGSGVRNLERTHQLSDEACEGLLNFPRELIPTSLRGRWESLIKVTQRALPLFYLRAAFNESGRRAGWSFWNGLRRQGKMAWHPLMLGSLAVATVLPQSASQGLFLWYQHSPALQQLMRGCLAEKDKKRL